MNDFDFFRLPLRREGNDNDLMYICNTQLRN